MINLIPPEAQKRVKIEYWTRTVTVWMFLLSGVFIVCAFLLVPSYVLVSSELRTLDLEFSKSSDIEETFNVVSEKVQVANSIIEQLDVPEPKATASDMLHAIDNIENSEITLRTFEITRVEGSINTVNIQGDAVSREGLARFIAELERSPMFESATVPISFLAKESNLPFAISISVAEIRKDL